MNKDDQNDINYSQLFQRSNKIRQEIVDICIKNNAGHIASSLSTVDILSCLYYGNTNLKLSSNQVRDRVILSKGHGCYAQYSILSDLGYIPKEEWHNFNTERSSLKGCVERNQSYRLEASTGSLGHGLPIAVGMAYAQIFTDNSYRVFCLLGDGELQEGSNWEALQFASGKKIKNLFIFVDCNRFQALSNVSDIFSLDEENLSMNIKKKFEAFGIATTICDGHDLRAIEDTMEVALANPKGPSAIIFETIKGYGIKSIENIAKFHYRVPSKNELCDIRWDINEL